MPLIEYTEPRIHICRGSRVDGVQMEFEFRPGAENEVPPDIWDNLKEFSSGCKALIRSGKLRELRIRTVKRIATSKIKDGHASASVPLADKFPPRRTDGKLSHAVEEPEPNPEEMEDVESMGEVNVAAMTFWEAIDLVGKVYTEATLLRFKDQESDHSKWGIKGNTRVTVIRAIDEQLAVVRTDPTKGSDMAESSAEIS